MSMYTPFRTPLEEGTARNVQKPDQFRKTTLVVAAATVIIVTAAIVVTVVIVRNSRRRLQTSSRTLSALAIAPSDGKVQTAVRSLPDGKRVEFKEDPDAWFEPEWEDVSQEEETVSVRQRQPSPTYEQEYEEEQEEERPTGKNTTISATGIEIPVFKGLGGGGELLANI